MIAHDVFLGAQDQRHRLVGDAVTQHQNRLLLVANGTCGAFFEVDGSPENLFGVVFQRTGGADLTVGFLPPVIHHEVYVHGLPLLPQIANAGIKACAVTVQFKITVAVHIATPQQNLYQLHLTVFGAFAARFQTEKRILRRILNLHQPHLCVLFDVECRAHQKVLFRFQRFILFPD